MRRAYYIINVIVATILFVFIVLSCSKKDDSSYNLRVMVKENFTDPYKQHENIEVDDYIPYTITIEDSDTNSENAEYRLTPVYEGQSYHQMLWKDFGLYVSNEDKITFKEEKYISFSKKGTHHFYIRPFVPGTFKHTYELQKFVGGEAIGKPIKLNISFNAVNVKVVIMDSFAFLYVNDGENETDRYLSPEGITQYYKIVTRYKKNGETARTVIEGILREDGWGYIFESAGFTGTITIEAFEQLTIEQKSGDLPPFVIDYYNIKVENWN